MLAERGGRAADRRRRSRERGERSRKLELAAARHALPDPARAQLGAGEQVGGALHDAAQQAGARGLLEEAERVLGLQARGEQRNELGGVGGAAFARGKARVGEPRLAEQLGEPRDGPDAFPHTRRPLPWVLAAFLAMLFFVPIASTELKVHLPVDSRIDRFAVIGLVLVWLLARGDQRAFLHTRRSKLFASAACVFLALAVASLLLDAGRIVNLGDFQLAEKRFALLGSSWCWPGSPSRRCASRT